MRSVCHVISDALMARDRVSQVLALSFRVSRSCVWTMRTRVRANRGMVPAVCTRNPTMDHVVLAVDLHTLSFARQYLQRTYVAEPTRSRFLASQMSVLNCIGYVSILPTRYDSPRPVNRLVWTRDHGPGVALRSCGGELCLKRRSARIPTATAACRRTAGSAITAQHTASRQAR